MGLTFTLAAGGGVAAGIDWGAAIALGAVIILK